MAITAPTGFDPVAKDGRCVSCRWVPVLNADVATVGIFTGDVVVPAATGSWLAASAGGGARTIGSVCTGVRYYDSAVGGRVYRKYIPPATTGGTTLKAYNLMEIQIVENVEDCLFRVKLDAAITMTSLGLNCDFTATAGSTTTGYSGHVITMTGAATTATLPFRLVKIDESAFNDNTAASSLAYVQFNIGTEPVYTGGDTGV